MFRSMIDVNSKVEYKQVVLVNAEWTLTVLMIYGNRLDSDRPFASMPGLLKEESAAARRY